jgi:hypothetical protein
MPRPTMSQSMCPMSARPADTNPMRIRAICTAMTTTITAPWNSRPWNAWNRRNRLCFSTMTATTEKIRPMQQGA